MRDTHPLSLKKKIAFSLVTTLMLLIALEAGLRLYVKSINFQKHDYYEYFTTTETAQGLTWKPHAGYSQDDEETGNYIYINSKGFKGREFPAAKAEDTFRIFAIGDSTVWGQNKKSCSWPDQLQESLETMGPIAGVKNVEVINAGVEGYDSRLAYLRFKNDVLPYQPDGVIVLVGWNDLFGQAPLEPSEIPTAKSKKPSFLTKSARLLNRLYITKATRRVLFGTLKPRVNHAISKPVTPEELKVFENFSPEYYINNMNSIIELAKREGIDLIFLTRMSILRDEIDEETRKKIFYPYFISNHRTLLTLHKTYNRALKTLAEEKNIPLIDIDATFDRIEEKEELFSDPLHVYCDGNTIIAEEIFKFLPPWLKEKVQNQLRSQS